MVQATCRRARSNAQDLPERCERVVWKLLQLHPSEDRRIVAGARQGRPHQSLSDPMPGASIAACSGASEHDWRCLELPLPASLAPSRPLGDPAVSPPSNPTGLIRENPSLLVRMDYYLEARSLDDLPIEIQNVSHWHAVAVYALA